MSLRIDSTEWISGALIIGNTGLGVLGSLIPASGEHGAGYAYNDLVLPADANKEICGRITTWPALATLTVDEDTSFTLSGPAGVHTFAYQLYVDGVATGPATTVTATIGSVSPTTSFTLQALSTYVGTTGVGASVHCSVTLTAPSTWVSSARVSPVASLGIVVGSVFLGGSELFIQPTASFNVLGLSTFLIGAGAAARASFNIIDSATFLISAQDGLPPSTVIQVHLLSPITPASRPHSKLLRMTQVFAGDEGTEITMDCGEDISAATIMRIVGHIDEDPGTRLSWTSVLLGTNSIRYITQAGDLAVAGVYTLQAYIEMPGWKGRGAIAKLEVLV